MGNERRRQRSKRGALNLDQSESRIVFGHHCSAKLCSTWASDCLIPENPNGREIGNFEQLTADHCHISGQLHVQLGSLRTYGHAKFDWDSFFCIISCYLGGHLHSYITKAAHANYSALTICVHWLLEFQIDAIRRKYGFNTLAATRHCAGD